jgi:hypothetical protein
MSATTRAARRPRQSAIPQATPSFNSGIPWRERVNVTMQDAARIKGCSVASVYKLGREGRLKLKRDAGRTLVDVQSLIADSERIPDWSPSHRNQAACAKRQALARAKREG